MKLATFDTANGPRIGAVHNGDTQILDLAKTAERAGKPPEAFASMLALIDADDRGLDLARALFDAHNGEADLNVPVASVRLLAPVPEPRQMRDGMSFAKHIQQAPRGVKAAMARARGDEAAALEALAEPLAELADVYRQQPILYITNRFSVTGHETTIKWPRYSKQMDYELEFGIFTRRTAANISAKTARDHIFGFTIFNDFSARDAQAKEMAGRLGPLKGKSFDGGNVLGPWIVTPDEIGDPYKLKAQARINGELWSDGITENMLFPFEELIAHVSNDETLHAGEFIGSGTVGSGCGLELGRFLKSGDVVELSVEKIGTLRNRVEQQG